MHLHVDLCCGLGGWQQPFRESPEWRSLGLDIRESVGPDVLGDVRALPIHASPTLLTASPPCTEFVRWMLPWYDEPDPDLSLVRACLSAVKTLQPDYWVLENSRALDQYWRPARTHHGAYYLWGEFPPVDVEDSWSGKMQVSGENPDRRAEIPYALAEALRQSVEWYL